MHKPESNFLLFVIIRTELETKHVKLREKTVDLFNKTLCTKYTSKCKKRTVTLQLRELELEQRHWNVPAVKLASGTVRGDTRLESLWGGRDFECRTLEQDCTANRHSTATFTRAAVSAQHCFFSGLSLSHNSAPTDIVVVWRLPHNLPPIIAEHDSSLVDLLQKTFLHKCM